jgi:hypothetical protein
MLPPRASSSQFNVLIATLAVAGFLEGAKADDASMFRRAFTGKVVDAAGQPVGGAIVEWGHFRAAPDERETALSNERGEYRIETTRAWQDFRLGVHKAGYQPQWHDGLIPARADAPSEINFTLSPSADLTGVVVAPGGVPIAGVSVLAEVGQIGDLSSRFSSPVSPTPFPGPERIATTNERGEFVLHDLSAGAPAIRNGEINFYTNQIRSDQVQLTFRLEGEWLGQQEFPVTGPVCYEVPESYLPLTPETTGACRGIVVDADTLEPITQFRVIRRHKTDGPSFHMGDGRFVIPDLRRGQQYEFRVFAEGYAPMAADMLATAADDPLEVTIGLKRHPSLRCQVVDGVNGEPIPDVRVVSGYYDPTQGWKYIEWSSFESYADGHHQLNDVQHVLTDADGRATFAEGDVPHTLVIFHPGYARMIVLPQERESLTADDGTLRIELAPESRINCHIVLDPIPGGTYGVQIQSLSGLQEVEEMYHGEGRANDDGEITIDRLRGGRYRLSIMLHVAQSGFPIWSTDVDLLDVEKLDVELGAPAGPHILSGVSQPFAFVSLSRQDGGTPNNFGTYADCDGRYAIAGLPAGSYRVGISVHSGVSGTHLNWQDSVEIAGDTQKDFAGR